ncbi:hypothetical protein NSQ26_07205 [Bacillus sp. FSL W7-1360]
MEIFLYPMLVAAFVFVIVLAVKVQKNNEKIAQDNKRALTGAEQFRIDQGIALKKILANHEEVLKNQQSLIQEIKYLREDLKND